MHQIRIHGRGGQGVVTAAELLSLAVFLDGKYAQAFPSFGSERTGAPVMAFCRISDRPIRTREPVTDPDAVLIQDSTLLHQVEVFGGLDPSGYVLLNSTLTFEALGISEFLANWPERHVCTVPADDIALRHLRRPLANAPLVGALAGLTGWVGFPSVQDAIRRKFSGPIGDANAAAAAEAYEYVTAHLLPPEVRLPC